MSQLNIMCADVAYLASRIEPVLEGLLAPNSVDVIITSPPFKAKDGLTDEVLWSLGRLAGWTLRPGGRAFVNFAQLRSEGFDRPFQAQRAILGGSKELHVGQTFTWVKSIAIPRYHRSIESYLKECDEAGVQPVAKAIRAILKGDGEVLQLGHYTPLTSSDRTANYGHEWVFTYYKSKEENLDKLAAGCAFAHKGNLTRGNRGKNGDVHCAGDAWFLPYKTTGNKAKKPSHGSKSTYSFPEEFAEKCLKISGVLNMTDRTPVVLDPFVGTGTTTAVAMRHGCEAIGIDIDPDMCRIASERS